MTLAEKIIDLIAQEKNDGAAIVTAIESLKAALAASNAKISDLSAQIATLSTEAAGVSGLQAQVVSDLQAQIEALQAEIANANTAADTIADINTPTVVEPVVTPTPEVVPTVQ